MAIRHIKKLFSINNQQGKVNHKHNETMCLWGCEEKGALDDVNVNLYIHYEQQYGHSLKKKKA